ncbi:hypothetical protein [Clostridium sp.]
MKKYLGTLMLLLTAVFVNSNPSSVLTIGVEEMPESMKKMR